MPGLYGFRSLIKNFISTSVLLFGRGNNTKRSFHARTRWSTMEAPFCIISRPNNKTEVDMKYLLGLRKPYKPGKGFFRHVWRVCLVKISGQVSVLRGNHALCTNALKYNWSSVLYYFIARDFLSTQKLEHSYWPKHNPNSEPEVDINLYYGFENHINLERGSLDIYEHYVLVKMSVQVSVLRGNHALFSIHGNLILWAMSKEPLSRFIWFLQP